MQAGDRCWTTFKSATQIGLTATPKETETVSHIEYFGEPSTPIRSTGHRDIPGAVQSGAVGLDKDLDGWRPERGKLDKYGRGIEDREYTQRDYDRAGDFGQAHRRSSPKKISEYLKPRPTSPRRLCSVKTSITPSACGRRWSMKMPIGRGKSPVRDADHRQRRREGAARQLHRSRKALSGAGHHQRLIDHRRRCADLSAHRPRPQHRIADRVQADHRSRHPHQRGL